MAPKNTLNPGQIASIDTGLREAHMMKKYLMSDFSRDVGNPRMNSTHYRTLMILSRKGPDCMKGICRHLGLEAGSFTPVADRLIEEGLIERGRDDMDRRRTLLRITPEGEKTTIRVKALINEHMAEKLSVLDKRILEELVDAMDLIRRVNVILWGTEI